MKNTYKLIIGLLLLFIFSVTFYFAQKAYNLAKILEKPIVKSINMPDKTEKDNVPTKDIITVFPIGQSKIYFETKDTKGIVKIDSEEFVSLIKIQEKNIGKTKLTIIIKATETAQYKDMVDLLDKLAFLRIKRYSIVGIAEDEEKRTKSFTK